MGLEQVMRLLMGLEQVMRPETMMMIFSETCVFVTCTFWQ